MRIKVDLDDTATRRLIILANEERRTVAEEAEVLLLRALGLWPEPEGPNAA